MSPPNFSSFSEASNKSPRKLKIFFNSLSATGHLNSTIGVAQALQKRGHEIVFVIEIDLQKQLEGYGFRVLPLTMQKGVDLTENPAAGFAKLLKEQGFFSNKSTYEKTKMFSQRNERAVFTVMMNHMIEFDPQLDRYISQERPDLFIYDQLFYFPCLAKQKIPWIKIMSCQPSCFIPREFGLAPPFSGYSLEEKDKFAAFHEMLENSFKQFTKDSQDQINKACRFVPTGSEYNLDIFFNIMSPYLNIYQYPEEIDYPEIAKCSLKVFSVDTFIRHEKNENFQLDASIKLSKPEEKLIFLSMGSMGGIDLDLMRRLFRILGKSPHKFIVSKGPLGDELELPANMWGENNLPQIEVLPLVDLVITHGGNNTVCETFRFGKPMLVMGLFGDQFDNGQRLTETGYGLRLEPYDFEDHQLLEAVEKLLNNSELKAKLQKAKSRIDKVDKKVMLCKRIEKIIEEYQQV